MKPLPPATRRWLVTATIAAAALALGLAFHRPLLGWFGIATAAPAAPPVVPTHVIGALHLSARPDPDPPAQKRNTLWLTVTDDTGRPVTDARVHVTWDMPAMGSMAEMKGDADIDAPTPGSYRARFDLPMTGGWALLVEVQADGRRVEAKYHLTVGVPGLVAMASEEHAGESGAVQVDAATRATIGLRTGTVVRAPLRVVIHALGQVVPDETRLTDVTLRVSGYIAQLDVDATGQAVRKGQRLFTLYSPELFAAEKEYLLALGSGTGDTRAAIACAAAEKLRLWGVSDRAIADLANAGAPIENVPFYAPASGFVLEKNVVAGAAVTAGQRLYRIAPLDEVWVDADIFEADLAAVRVGQPATITLPYVPGRTFTGRVTYVYPTLDNATRTGRVRVMVPNPDLALKPDMYADVVLTQDSGEALQVPASAVIYDGPRRIVFVDAGQGRLLPHDVTLGARAGDRDEVLSGLEEGDTVVTSGNFLIASESRLQAAATFWEGGRP